MGRFIPNYKPAAQNSNNFDCYKVYKLRVWNEEEEFYKVGRTYLTIERRFRDNKSKKLPYNYEIIGVEFFSSAIECCKREVEIHNNNKEFKYVPKIKFGGMHECFHKLKR